MYISRIHPSIYHLFLRHHATHSHPRAPPPPRPAPLVVFFTPHVPFTYFLAPVRFASRFVFPDPSRLVLMPVLALAALYIYICDTACVFS
ncbi:hypothetical protein C8R45DRAFT_979356 [Mycena sanguinolenta]|nr:hypothetical protein C8R45DRAFT_979356 [Mycena sanguinolenta]